MTEKPQTPQATARSPIAGCAILITAVLVMVFLVVFSGWVLFRQFDEIAKFTSAKPAPVAIEPITGKDTQITALTAKLDAFRKETEGGETAELALTPEETNLAIAAYDPFKDLRGTFRITGVENDTLKIAISFPMNGKPRLSRGDERGWLASDPRYLIGTMTARPALLKQEVVLEILSIDVPGGAKVAPEFIGQMSPYRITERYKEDKTIGSVMAKLTDARVAGGKFILRSGKGEAARDTISNTKVDAARDRLFTLLGIVFTAFLLFAGAVLFIGLRAKRRSEQKRGSC